MLLKIIKVDPEKINVQWLYHHVSAYEATRENLIEFEDTIRDLVEKSKTLPIGQCFRYDLAGEKTLIIDQGRIHLMLPLKTYEIDEEV